MQSTCSIDESRQFIINKSTVITLFITLATILGASLFGIIEYLSIISYSEIIWYLLSQDRLNIVLIISDAVTLYLVSALFHEIGHVVSVVLLRNKCAVILKILKVGIAPYPDSPLTLWYKLASTIELSSGIIYQTAIIALFTVFSTFANNIFCQAVAISQLLLYLFFACGYFKKKEDGAKIIYLWSK